MPEMTHPNLPADQRITRSDAQVPGYQRAGWQVADKPAPKRAKPKPEPETTTSEAPVAGDTTPKE